MKTKIGTLLMAMILGVGNLMAQPGPPPDSPEGEALSKEERKAEIKKMKREFLATEMNLTETEAPKFWALYDQHETEMSALRKEHHEIRKTLKSKSIDELTDAEAKDLLDKEMAFHEKRHALKQKFNNDLQGVISVKKILKLHKAERDFKRKLLRKMRKGKRGPRHGGMPPR